MLSSGWTIRMPVDVHLQMQAVQCAQTPRSRSTRLCRSCRRCDDCNGGGTVLVPAADASTNVVKAMQSPTRRGSLAGPAGRLTALYTGA